MDNKYRFVSDKTCNLCNVNKQSIADAYSYIDAFQYRDTSNNPHWELSIKRINKYNNGDYKYYIEEYNAHWSCLPKVIQDEYNNNIEQKNINKYKNKNLELNNKILCLETKNKQEKIKNTELKNINDKLSTNNNILLTENTELKLQLQTVQENKDYIKNENKELRNSIKEQELLIKQLLEQLNTKNKSMFNTLFS